MNLIDFSQNGGYRLKQASLSKMQMAYFEILKAFITYLKVPDSGNYIISGCEISGANITSGIMYIDGELCPFTQTAGDLTTKIKKDIQIDVLAFKSGSNLPVFRKTTAIVDVSGILLQNFVRVPEIPQLPANIVIDANYVHTDNNFTTTLLTKLNEIEALAEVNVQADWDVTNPASDAFIKNKPLIVETLKVGTVYVGSVSSFIGAGSTNPVSFLDIGTNDYIVIGQLSVGNGVACEWHITGKTATGFTLRINVSSTAGSVTATGVVFDYYILPNT